MKKLLLNIFLSFISYLLLIKPAFSHPHVQIELWVNFDIENNQLLEVSPKLKFDKKDSKLWIQALKKAGFDVNKPINPNKKKKFKNDFKHFLPINGYFSELIVNGKSVEIDGAKDIEINIIDNAFILSYKLKFESVDISQKTVAVSFYDVGYYYNIVLSEDDPISFNDADFSYEITDNPGFIHFLDKSRPKQVEIKNIAL